MQTLSFSPGAGLGARLLVILAATLQIATPALPSLGLGDSIGSQSDTVRTLITPAGWAFSIWGALYTGCFAFAFHQMLPRQADNDVLKGLRFPAAAAFLGNAAWAAYVQIYGLSLISVVIIVFTLVNLLIVYRRLSGWDLGFTSGERWLVVLPLSALTAWLTVATIVNIAAALRFHGIEAGDTAPLVAAFVILIGGLIASAALCRSAGNPAYGLVFIWALSAIYAAGGQKASIVGAAAVIAAILVVTGVIVGLRGGGKAQWLTGTPRRTQSDMSV